MHTVVNFIVVMCIVPLRLEKINTIFIMKSTKSYNTTQNKKKNK